MSGGGEPGPGRAHRLALPPGVHLEGALREGSGRVILELRSSAGERLRTFLVPRGTGHAFVESSHLALGYLGQGLSEAMAAVLRGLARSLQGVSLEGLDALLSLQHTGEALPDELALQLRVVPFLDLEATFDPAPALAEARRLGHHFRLEKQRAYGHHGGGWYGVTLRAPGGRTAPGDMGESSEPYAMTPAAAEFPQTLALAASLCDLDSARGIQLLRLDPGGRVAPHSDSPGRAVNYSLNLALNMPAGCRMEIGLSAEGERTPWTREIPFRPGSAFLLNVAEVHALSNDSEEARLHLVVRGLPRRDHSWLLARARGTTGLSGAASAQAALKARQPTPA